MKVYVNQKTLEMMQNLLPDTKNVFARLKAAVDLMNSVKVEVKEDLKDGEILLVKEESGNDE